MNTEVKTKEDFIIEASSLLRGQGCQKCRKESRSITFENFLERAKETHGEIYRYSKDYWILGETHTRVKCATHEWFRVNWYNHTQGGGCRGCYIETSKLSITDVQKRLKESYQDQYVLIEDSYESFLKASLIICKSHGVHEGYLSKLT